MRTWILALVSICLSVAAQFALKAGAAKPSVQAVLGQDLSFRTVLAIAGNGRILVGFLLYALGALLWVGVLARWDVSKAYPIVGLGIGLTAVTAVVIGEQVTLGRLFGVALICVGVFVVGRT